MNYNFNQKYNPLGSNKNKPNSNSNIPNQKNFNSQQLTNPVRKRRNRYNKRKSRFNDDQDNCYFKDEIEGHKSFYDFRFVNKGKITIDDLMNKIHDREQIELSFLDRLVVDKLSNDEESDVVKTVIKKLLDLLNAYQISSLSEEEKSIIKNRGYLKEKFN